MGKKLGKYIAVFDYFGKTLIFLSATSGGICIISFASIIGAPAGIATASFSLVFSFTTAIMKRILKITSNKNKKHNKIVMLTRSKLNSIETFEISHEEYKSIINEEENYRILKESIRMIKSSDELNKKENKTIENNKNIRENNENA